MAYDMPAPGDKQALNNHTLMIIQYHLCAQHPVAAGRASRHRPVSGQRKKGCGISAATR
ncbi:MAG: hypothetical protein WA159_15260 [Variovorax sp.]